MDIILKNGDSIHTDLNIVFEPPVEGTKGKIALSILQRPMDGKGWVHLWIDPATVKRIEP